MSRKNSGLQDTIGKFNQVAADNQRKLEQNPFSDQYDPNVDHRPKERYGRPEAGSKTEKRGIKAGDHVGREILVLCEWIDICATVQPDGSKAVTFGFLFKMYNRISDKLVGMLLRARKHKLVAFEGEMLYQKQDDEKLVTLLHPLSVITAAMEISQDPQHCLKFNLPLPPTETTDATATAK